MANKTRNTTIGGILGTLVLLIWGMVFWGFLADGLSVFKPQGLDPQVAISLEAAGTETGTYFHPWPKNTPETAEAWRAAHTEGPFFRLSYVREGADPQSPTKLALGAVHNLIVVVLASVLLLMAGTDRGFAARFGLVFIAGLMGTCMTVVGEPVWFHLPMDYAVGNLLYEVVAWALVAGVLAWAHRPHPDGARPKPDPA